MSAPRFNPFPGLRSFHTHEKHLFFGREAQTGEMLRRLGTTRFLAAVGPSGSGKSSLVRAGLIPELLGGVNTQAGSRWIVLVFRPGGSPLGALAGALAESELYGGELEDGALQIEATLRRSALGLAEAVRQAHPPPRTNVLVVVDQFEELFRFASARPAQQDLADAFVNLLLAACEEDDSVIHVILTMRSDFIGDCARFRGLAEAINRGQYLIPRLTRDQWRAAIEGPVRVGGGDMAPRLVQRLLNDVADDPDQLPVLQHALMRTWDHWVATLSAGQGDAAPLDLPHYEAVGGMAEALSRHAEEALAELPDDAHRRLAGRFFKLLTEKGSDGRGVRRPARFAVLQAATGATPAELERVAGVFRQAGRTFVLPGVEAELNPNTILDISHESLMRVWTRLRGWVDEEAQSAAIFRRLAETAALWREGASGLYRDPELALAVRWRDTDQQNEAWGQLQRGDFANAQRFLDESVAAARRDREEREAARRRELEQAQAQAAEHQRRARVFALVALVMAGLVVATVLTALKIQHLRQEAVARELEAVSRELAANALNQLEMDPELSVLLAREALRVRPTLMAEEVLRESLFASRIRFRLGHLDDPALRLAEYSPDGSRVIVAGEASTAGLWDPRTGQRVALLTGHTAGITSARFSSQGLVVTTSDDGSARVWNARDGQLVKILSADQQSVRAAEFNTDGTKLLTVSQDGTARIWGGNNWTNVVTLPGAGGPAHSAAFHPSAEVAVVVGDGESSRLWNLRPPPVPHILTGAPPDLNAVVFSPDGRLFATSSGDRGGEVWHGTNGVHFASVNRGAQSLTAGKQVVMAFPHGASDRLLAAEGDAVWIEQWNAAGESKRLPVPHEHGGDVVSVEFSPDDSQILTAGADKTARLSAGGPVQVLRGHQREVNRARFSPDRDWVLTASADGTAGLWDVSRGSVSRLPGGRTVKAEFSEDGQWAVTLDGTGNVWRWPSQAASNAVMIATNVGRFALSGDGRSVALFDRSGGARVWGGDTNRTGQLPPRATPRGEPAINREGTWLLWPVADAGAELWRLGKTTATVAGRSPEWARATAGLAAAAFSPDGRWLATVSGNTNVIIWELATHGQPTGVAGPRLFRSFVDPREVKKVFFSPDSTRLVTVSRDSTARGWPVESEGPGLPLWQLRHEVSINGASFSPDGLFLVTASSDGTARIWSARTGRLLATLRGPAVPMLDAAFTPGLATMVTVGREGEVRTFETGPCAPAGRLPEFARTRVTRDFTREERQRYLRDAEATQP